MRILYVALFAVLYAGNSLWNWETFNRSAVLDERRRPVFVAVPRPEVVKVTDLGFHALAADWYWIKGVNYFGDERNAHVAYGELYNYFDLVTQLDPKYFPAYLFGGWALPWNRGDHWVNTEEAAKLLERGVKEFPRDYRLRMQLAYIYSSYLHKYHEAGDQLSIAAQLPGAPSYLTSLATRMYATGGELTMARALAEHMLQQTRDPKEREAIKRRYEELVAAEMADSLTKQVDTFKAAHGRYPVSLGELKASGVEIPAPPLGGSWRYESLTGKVTSSVLDDRLTIFTHPHQLRGG